MMFFSFLRTCLISFATCLHEDRRRKWRRRRVVTDDTAVFMCDYRCSIWPLSSTCLDGHNFFLTLLFCVVCFMFIWNIDLTRTIQISKKYLMFSVEEVIYVSYQLCKIVQSLALQFSWDYICDCLPTPKGYLRNHSFKQSRFTFSVSANRTSAAVDYCGIVGYIYIHTRWFKYDRDYLCVNKSQFVPVIFEPPCTYATYVHKTHTFLWYITQP